MNARIPLLLLLCTATLPAAYGPPVLETATEFFAYGDFGGNGRRSYVVIDRASGGMRQANATAAGGLLLPAIHPTGITGITGVAVGRFTLTTHDAVAVTCPEANRVKIVGPIGAWFDAWPTGVGPCEIVGLALPGGSAGRDDLAAVTVRNNPIMVSGYRRSLLLNGSLAFSTWVSQTPTSQPFHPLAAVPANGEAATYAELRTNGSSLVFAIHDSQDPALPVLTQCAGVLTGSAVCFGNFNVKHTRSVFVFHVPNGGSIQVSALDASRALEVPVTHSLGMRLGWVQPVQAGAEVWLAGASDDGSDLRVFSFNASNVPGLVQTIRAPAGRRWSGLMPAADGGWFAASALPGQTASASLQRFTYQGGATPFAAGATYDLAPLRFEEIGSDILVFAGKPFRDNDPVLRGRFHTGGWTSQLNDEPQFGSQMEGIRETWQGATLGLGSPGAATLGLTPAGVTHGLANQLAPDASFYSLDPPVGNLLDAIVFDPPGGPQVSGIEVTLTTGHPASTIHYSLGEGDRWTTYSGPLGPFYKDTTIHAYVADATTKTPIQTVSYIFPAYPGEVDSDGDGVPDFVENQFGLDPLVSGLDADSDGVPDLQEILAGTNPKNPSDAPDPAAIQAYERYFETEVEPRSHSGVAHGVRLTLAPCIDPLTIKGNRTNVTVHRPDGTLEFEGLARSQPGGGVMLFSARRTVPNPPLFWVAGTPERFLIDLPDLTDYLKGRGLYRLLDFSAPPLYPLPKPALSGTTAEQVNQWVTAVRAHFTANAKVSVGGVASYLETVDLLLAECALGVIFNNRNLIFNKKITLTPFRNDTLPDRHPVQEDWLANLPSAGFGDDGYDWAELLAFIRAGVVGKDTTREGLEQLAREIYRIGFHAFDDPTEPLNRAPFDALRQFMDTGLVPNDYSRLLATPAGVLAAAVEFRTGFLKSLPERAHTAAPLTLVAGPDFDQSPWLRLEQQGTGIAHWLAAADGTPLPSPSGFRILPGCRFLVGGHLANHAGGGKLLMVDSITLLDAPMPGQIDSDGNLLADDWEAFLYGTLGNAPFADNDHDSYMTLQEMFEMTDPDYADDRPAVPVLDLRPPHLTIVRTGPGLFDLSWRWPAYYQQRIGFFLEGGPNLLDYQLVDPEVPGDAGGNYLAPVDATTAPPNYFFRAGMKLR